MSPIGPFPPGKTVGLARLPAVPLGSYGFSHGPFQSITLLISVSIMFSIVSIENTVICRITPQSSNNENTWGFCQAHTNCCKNVPFKMQNLL
jgi:hypothetical protein